ncbi:CinA family protein [Gammaproteobacteria bacterium]|nr:CinA family protein [Gammaproteobacteria bacterium]
MKELSKLCEPIADRLKANKQTISVSESSTGGLISAALLSIPGASAYYKGGSVIYTLASRKIFLNLSKQDVEGLEPMTESMALRFAEKTKEVLDSDWAIAELGIAGPTGSPYGVDPGTSVVAISGPSDNFVKIETGNTDRESNMIDFTKSALQLLSRTLT